MSEEGTVKWFDSKKGFGFIERAEGEDVFVHFSSLLMEGYKDLPEGSKVTFEIEKTERGLQATKVQVVEE